MEKLPVEFKTKWLEALRSGEYKQGVGKLFNPKDNSYCCLGVACHISGYDNKYIGNCGVITNEFDNIPTMLRAQRFFIANEVQELINMNDGKFNYLNKQQNFAQIADYIEQNF